MWVGDAKQGIHECWPAHLYTIANIYNQLTNLALRQN